MVMEWHRSGCTSSSSLPSLTMVAWYDVGWDPPALPIIPYSNHDGLGVRLAMIYHFSVATQEVNPGCKPWRCDPQSNISPWHVPLFCACPQWATQATDAVDERIIFVGGQSEEWERGPIWYGGVQIRWAWILARFDLFILSWFAKVSQSYWLQKSPLIIFQGRCFRATSKNYFF